MTKLKYKVGDKFKNNGKGFFEIVRIGADSDYPYLDIFETSYCEEYLDSLKKVEPSYKLRPTQWTLKMGDYEEQHYTLSIEDEGGGEFIVLKQTYLGQEIRMAKEEVDAICEALQVLKKSIKENES